MIVSYKVNVYHTCTCMNSKSVCVSIFVAIKSVCELMSVIYIY